MAKVISYKSDRARKLGFKKARRKNATTDGQLDLFAQTTRERSLKPKLNASSFQTALEHDGVDDQSALQFYKAALDDAVHRSDALCNMGIVYARFGDTVRAIDSFTKCLVEDPRHLEAHFNLANMYYDLENYLLAASHYEVALSIDEFFADAKFNLALTYLALKEDSKASEMLEQYLETCPEEEKRSAEKLLLFLSLRQR